MIKLTDDLFQTYNNNNGSVRVDILYNNTHDFFYCEIFKDDALTQGDTRIVNEYENEYLKFSSLTADYASFDAVTTFTLELKNEE